MDASRWQRVRVQLEELLELPAKRRAEALAHLDRDVAADVRRLLERDARGALEGPLEGALEAALRSWAEDPSPRLAPGRVLGSYRIERRIGAGGMGEVYEATQEHPRRRVALKVLAGPVRGEEERSRFRYEAEVLGRLRHPAIAQVLEAGTADGLPFIAMELVEGSRDVRAWVRERGCSVEEVVALVQRVCEAVAHGHRRGVIHRDLKPTNLLVDPGGAVKVIDFGIARPHGPGAVERTTRTRPGEVVGTLAYLSPEGWEGRAEAIDTRSDVYSLGVVLQELITGRRPFELEGLSLVDAAARVTRDEPRPLRAARPDLPEDLEWIVRRALERDRSRRYENAAELGAELGRFLRHQPVLAGPPTTRYRVARFLRRHRLAVSAAGLVLVSLLLGIVGLSVGLARARTSERLANRRLESEQRQRARAEAVTAFLVDMPRFVDAERLGADVPLLEVLRASARGLAERFADQPAVEASLRAVLGESLAPLGEQALAREQLARALALEKAAPEPDWTRRARLHRLLGELDGVDEDLAAAEERFDRAARILAEHCPDDARAALELRLAREEASTAHPADGIRRMEVLRREAVAALGATDELALRCGEALVELHAAGARFEDSRVLVEELLAAVARETSPDHPVALRLALRRALALENLARYREALDELERLRPRFAATFGADSLAELELVVHLARLQGFLGRTEDAEDLLRRALDVHGRRHGEGGRLGLSMALHLAETLLGQQRYADADATAARVLELAEEGRFARARVLARGLRAKAQQALGEYERAREHAQAGLDEFDRSPGVPPLVGLDVLKSLALPLISLGRYTEAAEHVARARAIAEDALPPGSQDFIMLQLLDGMIHLRTGQLEEARATLETCYADARAFYPEQPMLWLAPVSYLRQTFDALDRPDLRAELDADYEAGVRALEAGRGEPE